MTERAVRTAFGLLSAAGLGLVGAAAARAFSGGVPAPDRLVGVCANALVPRPSVAWLATFALAALLAVSLAHAGLAIASIARARARVRRLGADPRHLRGREVLVVPSRRATAFCAGLRRPRVHLSAATLRLLDDRQLDAVLAHEHHHALRRDPLRMAVRLAITRALFFLPALAALAERLDELAEQAADEHAVRAAGGDPRPLAGALLVFDGAGAPAGAGISAARVDRLTGAAAGWSVPRRTVAVAAAVLGALVLTLAASAPASSAAAALHVCLASIVILGTLSSPLAVAVAARRRPQPA